MAGKIKGLTVVIDGNTTKLSNAIKTVNTQAKSLQKELKGVTTLLAADPTNISLIAQKQQLLSSALADQKAKLEMLRAVEEQYFNQIGPHTQAQQAEFRNLQREIAQTEQKLKSLTQESITFGTSATSSVLALEAKMASLGNSCEVAGKKMLALSAGIAYIGYKGVQTAKEFDTAMSQVAATMGMTAEEMNDSNDAFAKLSATAEAMGATTKFTATQAAEGLNYLALAGYDANAACSALPTVLNLAAAGNMDLATASDLVTDAMSAMGYTTKQLAEDESLLVKFTDEMARTSSKANTSVQQLGEATLVAAGTCTTYKISQEEMNTALGILANNGIKAAEGGTALRNAILNLYNASSAAQPVMDELGITTSDAAGNMLPLENVLTQLNDSLQGMTEAEKAKAIATIFDKRVIAPAVALLNSMGTEVMSLSDALELAGVNAEDLGISTEQLQTALDSLAEGEDLATKLMNEFGLNEEQASLAAQSVTLSLDGSTTAFSDLKHEIENAGGACATMADTQLNNLEGSITLLKSAVDGALKTFGDELSPTIREVADSIASGVTAFNELDEGTKQNIVRLSLLVAAAGPLVLVFGKMLTGISKLIGGYASAKTALDLWRGGLSATQAVQVATGKVTDVLVTKTKAATNAAKTQSSTLRASIASMGAAKTAALGLGVALAAIVASAVVNQFIKWKEHTDNLRGATLGLRSAVQGIPDALSVEAKALNLVADATHSSAQSIDELISSQAKLADTINERNTQAQTDMAILQSYRNIIEELTGKTELTTEEEKRLHAALAALNDEFGTTYTLAGNAAQGYTLMSDGATVAKEEILALIDAQKQQIQFEVAKENYADLYRQQAEAAKTYAASILEQQRAYARLEEAQELACEGLDQYGGLTFAAAREVESANKQVQEARESLEAVDDALRLTEQSMGYAASAVSGTASAWESFIASHQVIQATLSETGFSLSQFQEDLEATGVGTDALASLTEADLALIAANYDGSIQSITGILAQFGIDAGAKGQEATLNFANALATGTEPAQLAGASLKDAALTGLDDAGRAATLGQDFNNGYIDSVGSSDAILRVTAKAASLVRAAIDAARREQDSNSPSKVMATLGDDFDDGYEAGIVRSAGGAAQASKNMVKDAIASAQTEAKRVRDVGIALRYKTQMERIGGGSASFAFASTNQEAKGTNTTNYYNIGEITLLAKDVADLKTFDDFARRLNQEARCTL